MHSSSHALINSCEILISNNSTTILEGYFCNKKIINLLGKNERISEINFLKKISKVVRSADQLFDAIKDIDKSEGLRIQKEKLNEIRNFDDDFDSFDSILDAIPIYKMLTFVFFIYKCLF